MVLNAPKTSVSNTALTTLLAPTPLRSTMVAVFYTHHVLLLELPETGERLVRLIAESTGTWVHQERAVRTLVLAFLSFAKKK